eukprot:PhM_4_TR2167/c0_g2_i1/m.10075
MSSECEAATTEKLMRASEVLINAGAGSAFCTAAADSVVRSRDGLKASSDLVAELAVSCVRQQQKAGSEKDKLASVAATAASKAPTQLVKAFSAACATSTAHADVALKARLAMVEGELAAQKATSEKLLSELMNVRKANVSSMKSAAEDREAVRESFLSLQKRSNHQSADLSAALIERAQHEAQLSLLSTVVSGLQHLEDEHKAAEVRDTTVGDDLSRETAKEINTLRREVARLKSALQHEMDMNETLRVRAKRAVGKRGQEGVEALEKVGELQRLVVQLRHEAATADARREEANVALDSLRRFMPSNVERSVCEFINTQQAIKNSFTAELAAMKSALDAKDREQYALREQVAAQLTTIQELNHRNTTLSTQLSNTQTSANSATRQSISELTSCIENSTRNTTSTTTHADMTATTNAKKMSAADQMCQRFQRELLPPVEALSAKLLEITRSIGEMTSANVSGRVEAEYLQSVGNEVALLRTAFTESAVRVHDIELATISDLQDNGERCRQLVETADVLQGENDKLRTRVVELERDLERLASQREVDGGVEGRVARVHELQRLQTRCADLETDLEEQKSLGTVLEQSVGSKSDEIRSLKAELNTASCRVAEVLAENERLRQYTSVVEENFRKMTDEWMVHVRCQAETQPIVATNADPESNTPSSVAKWESVMLSLENAANEVTTFIDGVKAQAAREEADNENSSTPTMYLFESVLGEVQKMWTRIAEATPTTNHQPADVSDSTGAPELTRDASRNSVMISPMLQPHNAPNPQVLALTAERNEARAAAERYQKSAAVAEEQLKTLMSELQQARAARDAALNSEGAVKKSLEAVQDSLQKAEENERRLSQKVEEVTAQQNSDSTVDKAAHDTVVKERDALKLRESTLTASTERLQARLATLQTHSMELETKLASMSSVPDASASSASLEALKNQNAAMSSANERLQASLQRSTARIGELEASQKDLAALRSENEALKALVARHKQLINELEAKVKSAATTPQQQPSDMQDALNRERALLQRAQAKLGSLQEANAKLEKELADEKKAHNAHKSDLIRALEMVRAVTQQQQQQQPKTPEKKE